MGVVCDGPAEKQNEEHRPFLLLRLLNAAFRSRFELCSADVQQPLAA